MESSFPRKMFTFGTQMARASFWIASAIIIEKKVRLFLSVTSYIIVPLPTCVDRCSFHIDVQITGDLGPVYGFQWRHFGAEYETMHSDYSGKGVDQLADVIKKIKENPNDRRIIMCAWNAKGLIFYHYAMDY